MDGYSGFLLGIHKMDRIRWVGIMIRHCVCVLEIWACELAVCLERMRGTTGRRVCEEACVSCDLARWRLLSLV
jgi:hypothetical protein